MPISDEFTLLKIVRNTLNAENHSDIQADSSDFDDCALVKIDEENSFAITSDFVRGTWFDPFRFGFMDYYDVWWYLIWANLSDLASCWAEPIGLTTAIRYGKSMDDEKFAEVFRWMNDICKKYNTSIIGWDSGSYESDVFCATAFWKVKTKKVMQRKNVENRDIICVTWNLGDAFAALAYLKNDLRTKNILSKPEEEKLMLSWKRLEPRIEEWKILSKECERVACEDISDGFKATAMQMSAISWNTFTFYEELFPISNEVKKIAKELNIDYLKLAFSASVDFELFCTLSEDDYYKMKKLFSEKWMNLIKVWVVDNNWENRIQRKNGEFTEIPGIEWKQQSWDFIKEIIS